jgi:hypothetical protein
MTQPEAWSFNFIMLPQITDCTDTVSPPEIPVLSPVFLQVPSNQSQPYSHDRNESCIRRTFAQASERRNKPCPICPITLIKRRVLYWALPRPKRRYGQSGTSCCIHRCAQRGYWVSGSGLSGDSRCRSHWPTCSQDSHRTPMTGAEDELRHIGRNACSACHTDDASRAASRLRAACVPAEFMSSTSKTPAHTTAKSCPLELDE